MKTLVIGLGNPLFRDDIAGICVVRKLVNYIKSPDINVVEASASGFDLLNLITGYDKAIIIDAVQSNRGKPGQIHKISIEMVQSSDTSFTSHSMDIIDTIKLGKRLALPLPGDIVIFGIEVKDISIPDGKLTPDIERAIPICLNQVLQEINLLQEEGHGDKSHSYCG